MKTTKFTLVTHPGTSDETRQEIEVNYRSALDQLASEGLFYPDEEPSIKTLAYQLVRCGFIPVEEGAYWELRYGDQRFAGN